MRFFDRFTRRRRAEKAPEHGTAEKAVKVPRAEDSPKREPKKELTVREEHERATKTTRQKYATGIVPHAVLLKPIVSEKSTYLHGFNQYVFKIAPNANKVTVKKAVYEAYHAQPASVKIIRVMGKQIVRGRTLGRRSSYKKAIVVMPKGVSLPIYESV